MGPQLSKRQSEWIDGQVVKAPKLKESSVHCRDKTRFNMLCVLLLFAGLVVLRYQEIILIEDNLSPTTRKDQN